jgi:UrcA family protein
MTNTFCSIARSALIATAMLAMAPVAQAQEGQQAGHDPAETAPRVEINLSGVDLTTPEGQEAARHRISGAAWAVCSQAPDIDGWHKQRAACLDNARQQASRQLADLQQKALAQRARLGKPVDYALKTQ